MSDFNNFSKELEKRIDEEQKKFCKTHRLSDAVFKEIIKETMLLGALIFAKLDREEFIKQNDLIPKPMQN